jgi:hypothetical protein
MKKPLDLGHTNAALDETATRTMMTKDDSNMI